jgi:hypothetical protein
VIHHRLTGGVAILSAALASCTIYNTPRVAPLAAAATGTPAVVESPVKVHLLDGSTAVYPLGVIVAGDTVRSARTTPKAVRYGLSLEVVGPAGSIPLDSVVGMESYQDAVNVPASAILSTLAVGVSALGIAATVVVISCINNPKCFGSCPTFYSDSAGTAVLEAEGFSYSIAPLFEARDVDRLRAQADSAGDLRLEVRNEAFETHYINQLGLLEVRHGVDELVLPGSRDEPLATSGFASPAAARDRAGRDVLAELLAADGRTFRSSSATLDHVTAEDANDYIDLTFPAPAGRDTVALVFRMRNSLLNTVLLYELMLGDPGVRSLDWLGRDLQQIGPAARLGRWYVEHMGMRVAVRDGALLKEVARIPDTGPVAWKDVAVLVPVPRGDTLRVRLSFPADDWRIDQVRLARDVRRPPVRTLEAVQVTTADRTEDTSALASIHAVDERYLVTSPGQRFWLRFHPGPTAGDSRRTFLLSSQGYYIEWLRGSWVRSEHLAATFEPSDNALVQTMRRWRAEADDLERRFAATRVPVR